jgi:DNA-directed RNA polymerase specialized sigma24 family protein
LTITVNDKSGRFGTHPRLEDKCWDGAVNAFLVAWGYVDRSQRGELDDDEEWIEDPAAFVCRCVWNELKSAFSKSQKRQENLKERTTDRAVQRRIIAAGLVKSGEWFRDDDEDSESYLDVEDPEPSGFKLLQDELERIEDALAACETARERLLIETAVVMERQLGRWPYITELARETDWHRETVTEDLTKILDRMHRQGRRQRSSSPVMAS